MRNNSKVPRITLLTSITLAIILEKTSKNRVSLFITEVHYQMFHFQLIVLSLQFFHQTIELKHRIQTPMFHPYSKIVHFQFYLNIYWFHQCLPKNI